MRAATQAEILGAARSRLVAGGVEQVTLRAIAAELGMTAPALYRYYDSREHLLEALIEVLYDELADVLFEARESQRGGTLKDRFVVTAAAFREWALKHRPEFGLLFGAPIPGVGIHIGGGVDASGDHDRGARFAQVWFELFIELWQTNPVSVPADSDVDPRLAQQLGPFIEALPVPVPLGAIVLYLSCWVRLYGAVCTEAFGHLSFALSDGQPLFDELCMDLANRLGLTHEQ